jgi:uncharacterized protein
LVFRTRGLARPHDVTLEPFYSVHHERLALYWSLFRPAAWAAHQQAIADIEAQIAAARARAVDRVDVGNTASERAHGMTVTGDGTHTGEVSGQTWRQILRNTTCTYTLATGGRENLTLLCVVGARDSHRRFDFWIGETKLAPPELDGQAPGLVRTFSLPIPPELSRGQSTLTVRIQPRDEWDATSANVFECLLVPTP